MNNATTDTLLHGLAYSAAALVTVNYYGLGGATTLFAVTNIIPALIIGILGIFIDIYLPRAEVYVDSQL